MDEQGKALNRRLAIALGWHMEHVGFKYMHFVSPDRKVFRVLHTLKGEEEALTASIEAAWQEVHDRFLLPNFYGSVDATLATLPEGEYAVLMYPPPVAGAQYSVRIVGLNGDATGHGSTYAEALAHARLAMAEAGGG